MNKFLTYIVLFHIPLFATAQTTVADTVTQTPVEVFREAPDAQQADGATATEPIYTNRSFESNFKEKYNDPDFDYRPKPVQKSFWDILGEWILILLGGSGIAFGWVGILIKTVAFIAIAFIIYLIVRSVLNKESMWIFGRARKKVITEDAEAENIHEMDFSRLIDETKTAGNYRLALRYYYLWVLKQLSLREIIDWNWDKTNTDYLYEIKDGKLRKDFEYLSYVYDYSWYGDFPVDEKAFAKAERSFKKTLNTL